MRRGTRRRGGRRRLLGLAGFASTAILAIFHGGLLWQRLIDGSLLQPIVVARWAASAFIAAALLQLWRSGLPLLRGRRAGVIWLIVALLHMVTPGAPPTAEPVVEGILPAALAVLAFLALVIAAPPDRWPTLGRHPSGSCPPGPRRAGNGWYGVLFSRPPPARLHP